MTDDGREGKTSNPGAKPNPDRRDFLAQVGRLAAYTPPTVSMVLSVSEKASAAGLGTSHPTLPPSTTAITDTTGTTGTTGTTPTQSSASAATVGVPSSDAALQRSEPGEQSTKLASVIDSMGLMKNS